MFRDVQYRHDCVLHYYINTFFGEVLDKFQIFCFHLQGRKSIMIRMRNPSELQYNNKKQIP